MKMLLFISIALLSQLTVKAQDNRTAPLTAIVQKISNSWQDVDASNKTGIKLESIEASFTLSKTTSIGGEIKIWIFKLGRKVEKTKTRGITLELSKGDEAKRVKITNDDATELTNFINATLVDFKKLNDQNLLPDLKKKKITIEIGLTIKKDNSIGGGYEIGIFSLSAEGGKNSEQGHTLKMVFTKE